MGYDIILPPYRAIVPNASLLAANERLNWGYKWAEADKMLEVGTGDGVVIFVLDTAGATQHPDLVGQQLEGGKYNRNFTNDKSPDDAHGHGHHCAGIAAAAMNEQGIRGGSPKRFDTPPIWKFPDTGKSFLCPSEGRHLPG